MQLDIDKFLGIGISTNVTYSIRADGRGGFGIYDNQGVKLDLHVTNFEWHQDALETIPRIKMEIYGDNFTFATEV